jgi:hypothetical protein
MKRSRRRFLRLLAAGSAAAAAAPLAAVTSAAPAARGTKRAPAPAARGAGKPGAGRAVPPVMAEEIRKQKANVEQALKAVRDYRLPPGSEPAFVFAPLQARKPERGS